MESFIVVATKKEFVVRKDMNVLVQVRVRTLVPAGTVFVLVLVQRTVQIYTVYYLTYLMSVL